MPRLSLTAGGNKGKKPVSARGVVDESFLPMFLGAGRATPVAAPARAPAKIPSKRQRKEALAQPLVLVQMPLPVPMPVEEEVEQAEQQPAAAWDEPQTGDGETAPGTEEEAPATADGTDDAHEGGPDDAQPSSAAADGPDDEGQAAAAAAGEEDDDEGGRSKRRRAHPPGRFDPQAYPPAKPRGRAKSKFDMLNKASTETLGQLHHLVPRLSDDGVAGWVGRVDAADGAPRAMETSWYRTPREAALAVDRCASPRSHGPPQGGALAAVAEGAHSVLCACGLASGGASAAAAKGAHQFSFSACAPRRARGPQVPVQAVRQGGVQLLHPRRAGH